MTGSLTRRAALALLGGFAAAAAADDRPAQFGLTAVVVRENLRFFDRWRQYLERRVGRPVRFVRRRSYREIMDLLETGEVDFAWICGYPYVRRRDPEFLELMAVPVYQGEPRYRSYIIVHKDSQIASLADLSGKVFAYSDPDSNSGYLQPRLMLVNAGVAPDSFFRLTFFTYNHAETVEAVANRVAEGGAVESYVWEFLARTNPALTNRTRVIARSDKYGFPPLVARLGSDGELRRRMGRAILGMHEDVDGRALLAELGLDAFAPGDPGLFDGIRLSMSRVSDAGARP